MNRFNMPLCYLTGSTSINTNFSIAFALVSAGSEDDFAWVLTQLNSLAAEFKLPPPQTILSHFSWPFKNAASKVYSGVTQQLCIRHVLRNIAYYTKKKWISTDQILDGSDREEAGDNNDIPRGPQAPADNAADDAAAFEPKRPFSQRREEFEGEIASAETVANRLMREGEHDNPLKRPLRSITDRHWPDTQDGFLKAVHVLTWQPTEDEFWEVWRALSREFNRQICMCFLCSHSRPLTAYIALLRYIFVYYMAYRNQWARFATCMYRNYGYFASAAGLESGSAEVKRLLVNRLANSHKLNQAIKEMIFTKRSEYVIQHGKEDSTVMVGYENVEVLKPLARNIGRVAIRQVYNQYDEARSEHAAGRITNCTGRFRAQWGLPCKHEIIAAFEAGGVITLERVDPHWHLKEKFVSPSPFYIVSVLIESAAYVQKQPSLTRPTPSSTKSAHEPSPPEISSGHATPQGPRRPKVPSDPCLSNQQARFPLPVSNHMLRRVPPCPGKLHRYGEAAVAVETLGAAEASEAVVAVVAVVVERRRHRPRPRHRHRQRH